jgi:hypothetical protein
LNDMRHGMQPIKQGQLKVVSIVEPSLCGFCQFASSADVEMADGSIRAMFHCRRRDCDNWQEKTDTIIPTGITNIR